jgi:hypothetical protein
MLPALLDGRLGIERLVEETVCLGDRLGGANAEGHNGGLSDGARRDRIVSPW